jgi:hypothetical protein
MPCLNIFLFPPTHQIHSSADVDEMVDKKGGAQDMYEFAGEADIVITCMTLNNETVGAFFFSKFLPHNHYLH